MVSRWVGGACWRDISPADSEEQMAKEGHDRQPLVIPSRWAFLIGGAVFLNIIISGL